VTGWPESADGQ